MHKKVVLGLTAGLFALAMWACGDGTIDAPSDKELIFVGKMSEELDARAVDSMVALCSVKLECKQAMELAFKNDKHIREITDSTIVDEDGDTTYIYSSGYLPSMSFAKDNSSSSAFIEEETISSANVSSSSRRGSGGSSEDEPVYIKSSASTSGDGEGQGAGVVVFSSSSAKNTDIKLSSSSSIEGESEDEPVIVISSTSSTSTSASSKSSASTAKCGTTPIEGTCSVDKNQIYKFEEVTWTYTPNPQTCDNGNAEWVYGSRSDGASSLSGENTLSFTISFNQKGPKQSTVFYMDGREHGFQCPTVTVEDCDKPFCRGSLKSASNDIKQESSGVKYEWSVKCLENSKNFTFQWETGLSGNASAWTTGSGRSVSFTETYKERGEYGARVTVNGSTIACDNTVKVRNSGEPFVIESNKNLKLDASENGAIIHYACKANEQKLTMFFEGGPATVVLKADKEVSAGTQNSSENREKGGILSSLFNNYNSGNDYSQRDIIFNYSGTGSVTMKCSQ